MEQLILALNSLGRWTIPVIVLAVIVLPQAFRVLREYPAAEGMVLATAMISGQPIARPLRFLHTLREISIEHNPAPFLPVPIGLSGPFSKGLD